jgi:hypothetical protein
VPARGAGRGEAATAPPIGSAHGEGPAENAPEQLFGGTAAAAAVAGAAGEGGGAREEARTGGFVVGLLGVCWGFVGGVLKEFTSP